MQAKGKVLITGVNGFLWSHIAKLLLEAGYLVRGTVRDKTNKDKLASLDNLPSPQNLQLYQADLLSSSDLEKAIEGCDHVMHVAAPVLMEGDESIIVKPAVEGTKFVMEAALKHKVKTIILTSSLIAVINMNVSRVLTEDDWPDMEQPQGPYTKAKALSEKAAWDIYNKIPKETKPKFVVINSGFILGPTMTRTPFYSGNIIREAMNGTLKAVPKLYFGIVDIRDVALAHIRALEKPEADGKRYICFSGDYLWVEDIVNITKEEFEQYGYKIDAKVLDGCPDKDPSSYLNSRWGKTFKVSNEKIKKELGMEFIKPRDSAIAMGYSLITQGLVPDLIKKHMV
jgi:nucleoside-diphosphate-sugar epimerase